MTRQQLKSNVSVVDYLKSVKQPSDFVSRRRLAEQHGITDYRGTAQQNTQLLNTLRRPTPTPAQQNTARQITAQKGETLWGIAQRELGAGHRWKELSGWGGRPEHLPVGQTLTIPTQQAPQTQQAPVQQAPVQQVQQTPVQQVQPVQQAPVQQDVVDTASYGERIKELEQTMFAPQVATPEMVAKQEEISQTQRDIQKATEIIRDNPWLSEAGRVGRERKLHEASQLKLQRLGRDYEIMQNQQQNIMQQQERELQYLLNREEHARGIKAEKRREVERRNEIKRIRQIEAEQKRDAVGMYRAMAQAVQAREVNLKNIPSEYRAEVARRVDWKDMPTEEKETTVPQEQDGAKAPLTKEEEKEKIEELRNQLIYEIQPKIDKVKTKYEESLKRKRFGLDILKKDKPFKEEEFHALLKEQGLDADTLDMYFIEQGVDPDDIWG